MKKGASVILLLLVLVSFSFVSAQSVTICELTGDPNLCEYDERLEEVEDLSEFCLISLMDLNNDCEVNMGDIDLFNSCWGSGTNCLYDVTGDDKMNQKDYLSINFDLSRHVFSREPPPPLEPWVASMHPVWHDAEDIKFGKTHSLQEWIDDESGTWDDSEHSQFHLSFDIRVELEGDDANLQSWINNQDRGWDLLVWGTELVDHVDSHHFPFSPKITIPSRFSRIILCSISISYLRHIINWIISF